MRGAGVDPETTVNYAAGRVYLFYGGAPLNGAADKIINGTVAGEIWGFALALLQEDDRYRPRFR